MMSLVNKAGKKAVLMTVAVAAATVLQAGEAVFSDDLSTLKNFDNKTVVTALWESDGSNAVYNQNGGGGASRATLISKQSFKFDDEKPVVFEFTSTWFGPRNRFEVGLVDAAAAAKYKNSIVVYSDIYGFSFIHTESYSEPGLLYNRGVRPAPGAGTAATIPTEESEGTHTYKIVFSAEDTELFRDGESVGKTNHTLDFGRRYKIAVFGQLYDEKSLDDVTLMQ